MSAHPDPIPANIDERFQELERRVADHQQQTQRQLSEVLQLLSQLTASSSGLTPSATMASSPIPEQVASFVSRRSLLKKAAMATLGAAAILETMPSARATDNSALLVGEANTSAGSTQLSSSVGSGPSFSAANTVAAGSITGSAASGSGVYGSSVSGSGVYGTSSSSYGVSGSSSSTSNAGVFGISSGKYGAGVYGTGSGAYSAGVTGSSAYIGVYGSSGSDTGTAGVSYAFSGIAQGYGAYLSGALAPLVLGANKNSVTNPNSDTNAHLNGELFVDSNGGLWYCAVAGMPGTWRKVADSGTAGSFALLSAPTRFIDTRPTSASYTGTAAPAPGSVVTTYKFSGTGALTPYEPNGTPAPSIPFGATGLVGRITVQTGKNGHVDAGGELQVSNVNPPSFGSGLIIWENTPSTQIVPFVLGLDNTTAASTGQMYFVNTSTSGDVIDLIVDVTGYYY